MLGRLFIDAVYYFPPIFECMTINDTIHRRIDLERQEIQKQSSMCLRRDVQNLVQRVIYAATLIFSAVFFSPRPVDTPSPIFFFGLSGVGKTTLIHQIANSDPKLFYVPKFTVTRSARKDDEKDFFEYITPTEFKQKKDRGEFYVWMNYGDVFYGYRFEHLKDSKRIPLMNGSPHGLDAIRKTKGLCILIEGDASRGLQLRNDPEMLKTRTKVNQIAQQFFNQNFRKKMALIFWNQFKSPEKSAKELKEKIVQKLKSIK